jgi:hypothetical protein
MHRHLAEGLRAELGKRGVSGLSLKDGDKLPLLDRFDTNTTESIYEFDRNRRRFWVASHHLHAASKLSDAEISGLAKKYLSLLEAPEVGLKDLPDVPFGATSAEPAAADKSSDEVKAPPKSAEKKVDKTGVVTLAPLEVENAKKETPEPSSRREDKPDAPKTPVQANPNATATAPDESKVINSITLREEPIPLYPRALTLDDPNIGYGVWIRGSYATVTVPEQAKAPSMFIAGELSLTRDIGVDVTIPISYVSVNVRRAAPLVQMGNPLINAKYRFHLFEVEGRRPVVAIRARWGIPISRQENIRPTDLDVKDFNQPPLFADTWAFVLEKHDFGLGVNTSYEKSVFHISGQFYADYFLPVPGAESTLKFLTLSYGGSLGIRPLGDLVGLYAEGRGLSLIAGPIRNEFFLYFGARAHFLDHIEPALWVSLPLGSVREVSPVQLGLEVRLTYDVEAVIEHGRSREAQQEDVNFLE